MSAPIRKGDRVTLQPSHFYDGRPVANWPDPQFIAEVREVFTSYGQVVARLRYPSGRKALELPSKLTKLDPQEAR